MDSTTELAREQWSDHSAHWSVVGRSLASHHHPASHRSVHSLTLSPIPLSPVVDFPSGSSTPLPSTPFMSAPGHDHPAPAPPATRSQTAVAAAQEEIPFARLEHAFVRAMVGSTADAVVGETAVKPNQLSHAASPFMPRQMQSAAHPPVRPPAG